MLRVALAAVLLLLSAMHNTSPLPALGFGLAALIAFETGMSRSCFLSVPLGHPPEGHRRGLTAVVSRESRSRTAS